MRCLHAQSYGNLRTAWCAKIFALDNIEREKRFLRISLCVMHTVFYRAQVPFPSLPCTTIIIIAFVGNGESKKKRREPNILHKSQYSLYNTKFFIFGKHY